MVNYKEVKRKREEETGTKKEAVAKGIFKGKKRWEEERRSEDRGAEMWRGSIVSVQAGVWLAADLPEGPRSLC